jgi:uncharacterized protein (DUF983 family)
MANQKPGTRNRATAALGKRLGRALRLRCPACGGGPLFHRWLAMVPECPRCGLVLEREQGYWTGSMAINLVTAELVFIAGLILALVLTWPAIPVVPLTLAAMAGMVGFPLLFHPFSRTLWLAFDITVQPPVRKEFRP